MRGFLIHVLPLALAGLFVYPRALTAQPSPIPVIDLHVDLSYRSLYKNTPFSSGSGQFLARSLIPAGVRGVVLPLYLPEELERSYAHVFRSILSTPPYSLFGCSIHRAGSEPRAVETWLAFEGSGPVGADLPEIRRWALRGVRSFGLTHSIDNALATSSGSPGPSQAGLSAEGRRFVEYVVSVGGLVDVSHASDAATSETLELAERLGGTVIATHSNARRLAPHPRNLSDAHIHGIARTGGVIGVNFHQRFLSPDGGRDATLADVVRQVQYLMKVGGEDAVALGSDFEGGIRPVPELRDANQFQRLADALLAAGLSRQLVRKIFYENARRVLCARPVD